MQREKGHVISRTESVGSAVTPMEQSQARKRMLLIVAVLTLPEFSVVIYSSTGVAL